MNSYSKAQKTCKALFESVVMLSVRSKATLGKFELGSTVILLPWRSQASYGRQRFPLLFAAQLPLVIC